MCDYFTLFLGANHISGFTHLLVIFFLCNCGCCFLCVLKVMSNCHSHDVTLVCVYGRFECKGWYNYYTVLCTGRVEKLLGRVSITLDLN